MALYPVDSKRAFFCSVCKQDFGVGVARLMDSISKRPVCSDCGARPSAGSGAPNITLDGDTLYRVLACFWQPHSTLSEAPATTWEPTLQMSTQQISAIGEICSAFLDYEQATPEPAKPALPDGFWARFDALCDSLPAGVGPAPAQDPETVI